MTDFTDSEGPTPHHVTTWSWQHVDRYGKSGVIHTALGLVQAGEIGNVTIFVMCWDGTTFCRRYERTFDTGAIKRRAREFAAEVVQKCVDRPFPGKPVTHDAPARRQAVLDRAETLSRINYEAAAVDAIVGPMQKRAG